jgi:hypothetical protein
MVLDIVRICGADEQPRGYVKPTQRLRQTLVHVGTAAVSIFLGLSEHFISHWLNESVAALWVAAFVTNLAFYPLRGEEKRDLPNFRLWAIYCALLAMASVVLSYIGDGLRAAMGAR